MYLENFMDELSFDHNTEEFLSLPQLFVEKMLKNTDNLFGTSVRINEILQFL